MLLGAQLYVGMGAPPAPLPAPPAQGARHLHFPQWSKTAILALSSIEDDIQVKKSPPEPAGSGFVISGDPATRVAHLEHSVRFLQEQHRLMLNGLHAEIEALRERNRDLQFQLIFNKESKESSPIPTSPIPSIEENAEISEENHLKSEVDRLEKEVAEVRSEVQVAEAHVVQLRQLVKVQADKIRELEAIPKCASCEENAASATASGGAGEDTTESRAELRARLADAEKLVRRLRTEAERRRREVAAASVVGAGGAVTNLLFDGTAARHAHLQCMKNSLHASLRATGLDAFGFQNTYHFPPVHHTPDFWREPIREDVSGRGRCARRPVLLPELGGQPGLRGATVYVNNHTSRPRQNGYEHKNKKPQTSTSNEVANGKTPEQDPPESRLSPKKENFLPSINSNVDPNFTYPELQIVVTKMIQHGNVSTVNAEGNRPRPRRPHRKHAAEHTLCKISEVQK